MDITHYYIESGSGEPLILLHGNGEDSSYFAHQIKYFSGKYRVLAVDTRGHGKTPRGNAGFTIRQFAEDLRIWMDSMGINTANILGFSDGGNIAMIFAMRYPARVNRLILNGANLNASGVKRRVQLPIELGYKMASVFAGFSRRAAKNAEMLGLMIHDPDVDAIELHKITAKTLVIAGTNDMIKQEHTKLIFQSIPHAKLVIIPGDHFAAKKNPHVFNQAVEKFLAE